MALTEQLTCCCDSNLITSPSRPRTATAKMEPLTATSASDEVEPTAIVGERCTRAFDFMDCLDGERMSGGATDAELEEPAQIIQLTP